MLDGNCDAIESSLARPRSSGAGSPSLVAAADELDSGAGSEDDSGADDDSDDDSGAADDDSDELGVDEPALCGFSVLAPHAEATMPATASAATTEVIRDKRDIDSCLSIAKVVLR